MCNALLQTFCFSTIIGISKPTQCRIACFLDMMWYDVGCVQTWYVGVWLSSAVIHRLSVSQMSRRSFVLSDGVNASLPDLTPHYTCVSVQLSSDFQLFLALFTIKVCNVHGVVVAGGSLWLQQYKFPHQIWAHQYLKGKLKLRTLEDSHLRKGCSFPGAWSSNLYSCVGKQRSQKCGHDLSLLCRRV